MANTYSNIAGIPLTVIAQETLPVLQKLLPKFSAFTSDFSGDASPVATAVVTRIPSVITAQDWATGTGYATMPATSSAVTITLNNHKHITLGFTDVELQQGGLAMLQRTFVTPAIFGVVNAMASTVFTMVSCSNFPMVGYSGSAFTFDNFSSAIQALDLSGSQGPRNVILNTPTYFSLLSDVKQNYVIGDSSVIREGVIGNLAGAQVWEVPGFTNGGAIAGALDSGFACTPSGIAIAARVPQVPGNLAYGEIASVTEPKSGFTIQLRSWYDMTLGQTKFSTTVIYGAAVGNTSCLARIIAK